MTEEVREALSFEGRTVNGRELKLSGSLAQLARLDDAHQIDDKLVVIGVFKVDRITHKLTPKAGFLRVEGAGALELHVVTGSSDALTLLQEAREADQAAIDAILGRSALPFDDDAQVTDESLHRLIDGETGEITPDDDYEQQLRDAIATPIADPPEDPETPTVE